MKRMILILLPVIILASLSFLWFKNQLGDVELGKQIYEKGILSDGSPLQATTEGGGKLEGAIVSCAQCHRKSGFGSFEGNIYVPPITSDVLFEDQLRERADMIRSVYHE